MQSSAAAYGVYTFKTSSQGEKIPVGTDGFLEEYYLNFWKGPYVVTVIGFDSEKETLDAILLAARKVIILADWEFCEKGIEDWTRKLTTILRG